MFGINSELCVVRCGTQLHLISFASLSQFCNVSCAGILEFAPSSLSVPLRVFFFLQSLPARPFALSSSASKWVFISLFVNPPMVLGHSYMTSSKFPCYFLLLKTTDFVPFVPCFFSGLPSVQIAYMWISYMCAPRQGAPCPLRVRACACPKAPFIYPFLLSYKGVWATIEAGKKGVRGGSRRMQSSNV